MAQDKIRAPMACTVIEVLVGDGQAVRAGQLLLIVEAMKMEHEICAPADARVLSVSTRAGEMVGEGDLLISLGAAAVAKAGGDISEAPDAAHEPTPPGLRADLQEVN